MKTMMRLLSVGRGIHGGKAKASPYKFVGKPAAPIFSPRSANPFHKEGEVALETDESEVETEVARPRQAPIFSRVLEKPMPVEKVLERLVEPVGPEAPDLEEAAQAQPDPERTVGTPNPFANAIRRRKRYTLWNLVTHFFTPKRKPEPTFFIQEELGLDAVTVKCNDLLDDDLEVVRAPRRTSQTSGDTVWGRLNAKFFPGDSK